MNVDVYDITKPANIAWRERFEEYRTAVMLGSKIRAENYSQKRFNIDQQLGAYLMVNRDADEIAAICSVYTPPHWPKNIARMFNRSWIDPAYRAKGISRSDGVTRFAGQGRLGKWCQTYAYTHMVETCRQAEVDVGVCTRENTGPKNNITHLLKNARDADERWNIREEYFLTCPDDNAMACWQRLIYVPITECDMNEVLGQLRTCSQTEFRNRFLDSTQASSPRALPAITP